MEKLRRIFSYFLPKENNVETNLNYLNEMAKSQPYLLSIILYKLDEESLQTLSEFSKEIELVCKKYNLMNQFLGTVLVHFKLKPTDYGGNITGLNGKLIKQICGIFLLNADGNIFYYSFRGNSFIGNAKIVKLKIEKTTFKEIVFCDFNDYLLLTTKGTVLQYNSSNFITKIKLDTKIIHCAGNSSIGYWFYIDENGNVFIHKERSIIEMVPFPEKIKYVHCGIGAIGKCCCFISISDKFYFLQLMDKLQPELVYENVKKVIRYWRYVFILTINNKIICYNFEHKKIMLFFDLIEIPWSKNENVINIFDSQHFELIVVTTDNSEYNYCYAFKAKNNNLIFEKVRTIKGKVIGFSDGVENNIYDSYLVSTFVPSPHLLLNCKCGNIGRFVTFDDNYSIVCEKKACQEISK